MSNEKLSAILDFPFDKDGHLTIDDFHVLAGQARELEAEVEELQQQAKNKQCPTCFGLCPHCYPEAAYGQEVDTLLRKVQETERWWQDWESSMQCTVWEWFAARGPTNTELAKSAAREATHD